MEIIVVLAVLLIVTAITVPVVNKASERGLNVTCQSHLRNLLTASFDYSGDHYGSLPENYLGNSESKRLAWYLSLAGIKYAGDSMTGSYQTSYLPHEGFGKNSGDYFCPSYPNPATKGDLAWTTYAMNRALIGAKIANVSSRKVVFMDSLLIPSAQSFALYGPRVSSQWSRYHPVHGNSSNFIFMDGQVVSVPIGDPTSTSSTETISQWFYPIDN